MHSQDCTKTSIIPLIMHLKHIHGNKGRNHPGNMNFSNKALMSQLKLSKMVGFLKKSQNIWVLRDDDNYLVQLPHFTVEYDPRQAPGPMSPGLLVVHVWNLNLGPKTNLFYIYYIAANEDCLNWLGSVTSHWHLKLQNVNVIYSAFLRQFH